MDLKSVFGLELPPGCRKGETSPDERRSEEHGVHRERPSLEMRALRDPRTGFAPLTADARHVSLGPRSFRGFPGIAQPPFFVRLTVSREEKPVHLVSLSHPLRAKHGASCNIIASTRNSCEPTTRQARFWEAECVANRADELPSLSNARPSR